MVSRHMLRLAVIVGFVVSPGCKDVAADVEALAERACKCTDAACAEKVIDDLVAFAAKHKTPRGNQERAEKAAQKLGACVVKVGVDPAKFVAKMQSLGK